MVRRTTVVAGNTGQLRAGVIRINRVEPAVSFVGVGDGYSLKGTKALLL